MDDETASDVPTARRDEAVDRANPGFEAAVRSVLASLDPGDVVTYGEVAAEAGHPGAARAVGNLLAASGATLPWWRVVTATGRLAPGKAHDHAARLRAEGVTIVGGRVRQHAAPQPGARAGEVGRDRSKPAVR